MIMMLFAAVLAVVSISPSMLNLASWGGMCSGKMQVYVPSHADNRRIVIQQSDGSDEVEVSEADVTMRGYSRELVFAMFEGEQRTITAWVYGPDRDKIRGTSVARAECH